MAETDWLFFLTTGRYESRFETLAGVICLSSEARGDMHNYERACVTIAVSGPKSFLGTIPPDLGDLSHEM